MQGDWGAEADVILRVDGGMSASDWTMQGLSSDCKQAREYLEVIEDFTSTFEFVFFEELECRVQKLRIQVWDCQYEALQEMVKYEVAEEEFEGRVKELMEEYQMGERPEPCNFNE